MITRGYFIGEIVDELSTIAHQVESRCHLGLFDLNKYLEVFFGDILNPVLNYNLQDLNGDRSNNPGLDLGDPINQVAFQITSQKTSDKVNATLAAITEHQLETYKEIYVLIIGHKQAQYTLDDDLSKRCNFSKDKNIWDIDNLLARCLALQLDKLKDVYDIIHANCARVRIELEIPDTQGNYPTNIHDYMEVPATPKFGECNHLLQWVKDKYGVNDMGIDDYSRPLQTLVKTFT